MRRMSAPLLLLATLLVSSASWSAPAAKRQGRAQAPAPAKTNAPRRVKAPGAKSALLKAAATKPASAADFALLQEAIFHRPGKQGGVIPFMKEMATSGQVKSPKGTITLAKFKQIWQASKTDAQWVENEFRAARPNDHEWIPSNYMANVIDRARTSDEKLKWIDLQDQMRTATELIIFKPEKGVVAKVGDKSYTVLQGHVGALNQAKKDGAPLIVGMEEFHNELRAVFDSTKTIKDCVTGIKGVVAKWVWNGEAPAFPIHPEVFYHGGSPVGKDPQMIAKAKANYAAINAMLDGIIAKGVQ